MLRPHQAADGALVRLRLVGGAISGSSLARLSAAADEFGDGSVQLTSRANLQIRGIAIDESGEVPIGLHDAVVQAGLLPHPTHEQVRNIGVSPLTGRAGGLADLRAVARDLDPLLCADPLLAGLPGRFLFCLDDGHGDVAGLRFDLGIVAVDTKTAQVVVGDGLTGPVVALDEAAHTLIDLARGFMSVRGEGTTAAWHVDELPFGGAELVAQPANRAAVAAIPAIACPYEMPYGLLRQGDGRTAVSLLVPLGVLRPPQSAALVAAARHGSGQLVVTPWRGVVVPDLEPADADDVTARLTDAGLIADAGSPWVGVTACAGAPGCASASVETRAVAAQIVDFPRDHPELPVHVVACERRCGAPATDHVEVIATADGLTVGRRLPHEQHRSTP